MLCPISPAAAGRLTRETTPSLQVSPESGITSMSMSASTRGNLKQSFASLHPMQPSLRRPLLVPSLQFLALAIAITGDIAIAITGGPTFSSFCLKLTFLVRASQVSKEGEESEYPAYGVTGPAKEVSWSQELDSIAISVFVFLF